jgi:hypothetical protein
MKNVKLSEFEIYLIKESLKHYKQLISQQEFPTNSIVTKEYVFMMMDQLEEKLKEKTIKKHATA